MSQEVPIFFILRIAVWYMILRKTHEISTLTANYFRSTYSDVFEKLVYAYEWLAKEKKILLFPAIICFQI